MVQSAEVKAESTRLWKKYRAVIPEDAHEVFLDQLQAAIDSAGKKFLDTTDLMGIFLWHESPQGHNYWAYWEAHLTEKAHPGINLESWMFPDTAKLCK